MLETGTHTHEGVAAAFQIQVTADFRTSAAWEETEHL